MTTAQRVSHTDASDSFVFARSMLAYREAARRVGGTVLEIGTGGGYGVEALAGAAVSLVTVDKHPPAGPALPPNAEFRRMRVPPVDFPPCTFDFVVSFQVIEHLKDDFAFLDEVSRVLKHGGQFIVTTPNAPMSLTRNPWHVREYTAGEFTNLLECSFDKVEALGVFGNGRVMEYYGRNRASVEQFARLDPLSLRDRLPRWMLRLPYDMLNRLNRRRLLRENGSPAGSIAPDDYYVAPAGEGAFDLFYIATKL